MAYAQRLDSVLKREDPNYYHSAVILIDGAKYHVAKESLMFMKQLGWRVIVSAPYSYASSPIELFFALLKSTDLNPSALPAGKRKCKLADPSV